MLPAIYFFGRAFLCGDQAAVDVGVWSGEDGWTTRQSIYGTDGMV